MIETQSQITPYELLGGERSLRELVERFYALMDSVPEYYGIRKLHPASLDSSTDKLFMFLSGWLGGPSLYIEKFGHPRLRARHLPFVIGPAERDQWMACMMQAMIDVDVEPQMRTYLYEALSHTAEKMRNRED
jgi:hemoglobin